MPLYGDGRSGTFSATVTQYGGYQTPSAPPTATGPGLSRLISQPAATAGGSGADPATIASLKTRYVAADLALSLGAAVTSWAPRTGTGALAQATAGSQPTFRTAGNSTVNAAAAVRFDGVDDFLSTTMGSGFATEATFAVIFKNARYNTFEEIIEAPPIEVLNLGAGLTRLYSGTNLDATTATPTTGPVVLIATATSGTSDTLHINGTEFANGTAGNPTVNSALRVGAYSGGGRAWSADVAEILFFNTALTAAERATVDSYAQDTYGIVVSDYAAAGTAATASGSITLDGSVAALATAATAGTVTLGGSSTAASTAGASGTVSLGGSVAATAPVVASGTVTLGGTVAARGGAVAGGTVTLSGTATVGTPPSSAAGSVTLGGSVTARAATTASGAILLGGTSTARASAATSGTVTLGGSATARVPATAAGLITLSGLANAQAATYVTHTYVTFTLTSSGACMFVLNSNGVGTLTVSNSVGYFAVTNSSTTATLANNDPSTFALAGNGVGELTVVDTAAAFAVQTAT